MTCASFLYCLSAWCFFIGGVLYFTRKREGLPPLAAGAPGRRSPEPAAARPRPTAPRVPPPTVERTGDTMRDRFFNAGLGQTITVKHPERGPITGKIIGTIRYAELWQRVNSPAEPWVPTGNEFAAHWLGNFMLYEWQGRLYLLDAYDALTDRDIQATFIPPAKRFAQSDQTAQVSFAYPPASWTMVDIGKFSVTSAEGQGLRLSPGAVGRFIHASGRDNRALVVEDYQSGQGGQDTAWIGWTIGWEDVVEIRE